MHKQAPAMPQDDRKPLPPGVDQLPDACRTIYLMCAMQGMSVAQVASSLRLPEATVRVRLAHATGLMRGRLASQHDAAMGAAFSFDGARCDRITARTLELAKAQGLHTDSD